MQDLKSPLGKPWAEITREERYFCAELFFEIRKDVNRFIKFLNTNTELQLNPELEWEVGYEVCFYRDLLYANRKRVRKYPEFHFKRTFDICLFSNTQLIIIEAKAHEDFNPIQMKNLLDDPERIKKLLNDLNIQNLDVIICLLYSSKKPTNISLSKFTWKNLFEEYHNPIFDIADKLPDRTKPLD